MKRRNFLKLSAVTGAALCAPVSALAARLDPSQISFSTEVYNANAAQTIIVFLYGGASQLAGNLTNIDEIKSKSQSDYDDYFGKNKITVTANGCWQQAGGAHIESMIASEDMTLFRSCYSAAREKVNNKAHGVCVEQNQKGSFEENSAGVLTNLSQILEHNGVIDADTILPFVTLDGNSKFYAQEGPYALYPVGVTSDFSNPYARYGDYDWRYYTRAERVANPKTYNKIPALLHKKMDDLSLRYNRNPKIKYAFNKRAELDLFMKEMKDVATPDLGANAYPNLRFARNLESAVKIISNNADTKVVTISGSSGLGGWDDHDDGKEYVDRSEDLFKSLKSAVAHLKALNKLDNVNIMVFGDFGRNVNLNSSLGWDHGNLQNFYLFGGKKYFTHQGVVGETVLTQTGPINRLFQAPKVDSYQFEPLSIAATIYKLYGITNPELLTDSNLPIEI